MKAAAEPALIKRCAHGRAQAGSHRDCGWRRRPCSGRRRLRERSPAGPHAGRTGCLHSALIRHVVSARVDGFGVRATSRGLLGTFSDRRPREGEVLRLVGHQATSLAEGVAAIRSFRIRHASEHPASLLGSGMHVCVAA